MSLYDKMCVACSGILNDVISLVGDDVNKVDNDDGATLLIIAIWLGKLDVVCYLLEQGADRDKADHKGRTPLHWAASEGRFEIAKQLMVYGADLNARNNDGRLPIERAWHEDMKQAIHDEPRRRMDHGHKRATEEYRYPNVATSTSPHQEEAAEDETSNKKPRLELYDVEEVKGAQENEDPETSDGEDD